MSEFSRGFVLAFHEIPPERLAEFVDCLRPAQPVHLSELGQRSKERQLSGYDELGPPRLCQPLAAAENPSLSQEFNPVRAIEGPS
jgi:hypothetical protein